MIYTKLDQLAERVRAAGASAKTMAVVAADDRHTLEAATHALADGIVPLLFGDRGGITAKLRELAFDPADFEIVDATSDEDCVGAAVEAVRAGRAAFLMKGLIPTNVLMKTLFSAQSGFRAGDLVSHVSVVEIPSYHKLLAITDAAINIRPDLTQKRAMIENAVAALRGMGFDPPKVAVLAAVEQVNARMPETTDARALRDMNQNGWLAECVVEGPLSYDLAISREAAAIKGVVSPVCGDADLLVTPDLAAGNILLKALRYSARIRSAGIVVGGRVPVVLTSRAADADDKYWPVILAASVAAQ
jgi:phosphate butyryltransferase